MDERTTATVQKIAGAAGAKRRLFAASANLSQAYAPCPEVAESFTGRDVRVLLVVFALGGLILAVTPAAAQPNEGASWTLEKLVATALDRNFGLAAARTATSAAKEDIVAAKGQRLPRLDAVGKTEYFPRRERLLIFRHGFRGDDNPFEDAILNYGLEVTLPLYTSGRIEHGISLAEARTEAVRARAKLTRVELIFNVASGYYTALRLRKVITAQEAVLNSLNESQRIGKLQAEVGRIAPLDILRLNARVSQAERDLAGARNAYARVLEVLKELINFPIKESLDITGELIPAPTEVPLDALRDQALAQRPDLVSLRHEVQAKKAAVGLAESRLGPRVDFRAGYRGVTGIDDGVTKDDAGVFVDLRMPLYEGGVLRAQSRKAMIELREFQQRLRGAERRALAELERAALDLAAAEPRIRAARRAVDQAEESLRVEREKFGQGRGTSNDLLLAEEALLRSRTELAATLADSQIAWAALKLAAGEDPVAVTAPSTSRKGGG